MRRIAGFILSLTLVAGASAQQKKRVAVMNFDYATVQSSVAALFGTNQDIGKGIADILVDKLVNDGAYSVIERKQLDKVLAEQNFSNSDRADPASAAKIALAFWAWMPSSWEASRSSVVTTRVPLWAAVRRRVH